MIKSLIRKYIKIRQYLPRACQYIRTIIVIISLYADVAYSKNRKLNSIEILLKKTKLFLFCVSNMLMMNQNIA